MPQLLFTELVKLAKEDQIIIYRGFAENKNFFAYVLCNKDGLIRLRKDYANSTASQVNSYGKVIYGDFIIDPDDKAKEFLEQFVEQYTEIKD